MREIGGKIQTVLKDKTDTVALDNLLFSITHMTVNRWFRANNRLHELVVYDFLNKYYESAYVPGEKRNPVEVINSK